MENKAIFLLLILCCTMSAQNAEITKQYVAYGDYVKQYAIIQISTSSGTYQTPCLDCTASANISLNAYIKLQDVKMDQLASGLFGFKCPTSLQMNQTYFMRVTTISPTYGKGFTDSYFTIIPASEAASIVSTTQTQTTADSSGSLVDFSSLTKSITDYIDKFLKDTGLRGAFDFISGFVTWLIGVIGFFWDILKAITGAAIALLKNPKAEIEVIYNWLLNGALWIGGLFFVFFMVAEAVIIGFSIEDKDGFRSLSRWFMLHLSMFGMIGALFTFVFEKTMRVLRAIMDLISQINPIGRGT